MTDQSFSELLSSLSDLTKTDSVEDDLELVLKSFESDDDSDMTFADAFMAFMLSAASATGGGAETGQSLEVSSSAELLAALKAATGGETILLRAGSYEGLVKGVRPGEAVVIRSADGGNPAVFTDLDIRDSANLVFDGVRVDGSLADGEPDTSKTVVVRDSSNIAFLDSEFAGSEDGNYGNDGFGFYAQGVSGLILAGNEFHDLHRGSVVTDSTDVVVRDNVVHHIRRDGMDFAGVKNVLIEANHYSSFFPDEGDHADFIQFWTNNFGGSEHVVIRNNVLLRGEVQQADGRAQIQGMLIGNKVDGNYYSDFLVEGNVYYGSSTHGISFESVRDSVIRHNTVVGTPDSRYLSGINLRDTQNVEVDSNVAMRFRQDNDAGTTMNNNVVAQYEDPLAATHVDQLFVNAFADADAGVADLSPRSGGLLDGASPVGAVSLDGEPILVDGDEGTQTPDAGTEEPLPLEPSGVEEPASGGIDDGGPTLAAEGMLLDQRFDGGLSSSPQGLTGQWVGNALYGAGLDGEAAEFTGDGSYISVDVPEDFGGGETLTLQFDVRADGLADTQRLLWYHQGYGVDLKDQRLVVTIYDDGGERSTLAADASRLADGGWHQVTVSYSAEFGQFTAYLDAEEVARGDAASPIASVEKRDISIGGSPWGKAFDGMIDNLKIARAYVDPADYREDFDGADAGLDFHGGAGLVDGPWGKAASFDGKGDYISLGQPAEVFDADRLSVSLDFKLDGSAGGGRSPLLWNHTQFGVELKDDALVFRLWTEAGKQLKVEVNELNFEDGQWHKVGFALDEAAGTFRGFYDGEMVAELANTDASIGTASSWDVFLGGTPWGNSLNGAIDNLLVYDGVADPAADGSHRLLTDGSDLGLEFHHSGGTLS